MKRLTVELIPDAEQGGFTARVPDIPAYGEGATEDEAIADLREALLAYIEEFGVEDAMARLNQPTALRLLDLELENLIHAYAAAPNRRGEGPIFGIARIPPHACPWKPAHSVERRVVDHNSSSWRPDPSDWNAARHSSRC